MPTILHIFLYNISILYNLWRGRRWCQRPHPIPIFNLHYSSTFPEPHNDYLLLFIIWYILYSNKCFRSSYPNSLAFEDIIGLLFVLILVLFFAIFHIILLKFLFRIFTVPSFFPSNKSSNSRVFWKFNRFELSIWEEAEDRAKYIEDKADASYNIIVGLPWSAYR